MKKRKSIIGAFLLSTVLAGNVFAGEITGVGIYDFFGSIYDAVVSLASGGSPCETRQCQTCKPKEEGGNGNCRPTQN